MTKTNVCELVIFYAKDGEAGEGIDEVKRPKLIAIEINDA
jgi:hypothetical protein